MEELSLFVRIIEALRAQPVLTLFLILGIGYLIGYIRIKSFSLGPVAGVLFAGLFSAILISAYQPVRRRLDLRYSFFLSVIRLDRGFFMY